MFVPKADCIYPLYTLVSNSANQESTTSIWIVNVREKRPTDCVQCFLQVLNVQHQQQFYLGEKKKICGRLLYHFSATT